MNKPVFERKNLGIKQKFRQFYYGNSEQKILYRANLDTFTTVRNMICSKSVRLRQFCYGKKPAEN